ncbi:magnesium transporter [Haloimpatiens sp. FM7330]|uniref:magnesium transporter n=1 Tax=Haloimpatiens sp. FM7330 TaxID=3298610 RepID=UPI00362B1298
MKKTCNFYLSQILNQRVYDEFNDCIGTLKDIYVTTDKGYPRVIGYKIKGNREVFNYEFRNIEFYEDSNKFTIKVRGVKDIIPRKYSYLLSENLLNKKIVDVNGKKVIKVEDLTLFQNVSEIKVVAVTSGILSVARRMGMNRFISSIYNIFGKKPNEDIVMWESVESIEMVDNNLRLTVPYEKLSKLHPADIADILEDLDTKDRKKIFESLDRDLAADTLEEIEHEVQVDILKSVNTLRIKEVLENMPNDEIADMLEDMDQQQVERILLNLTKDDEKEIRNLMQYEDETIGSIMNKDFISLNVNITAQETIDILRQTKPDEEVIYNIYIVDENQKLQGIVPLVDLITSSPESKLEDIMDSQIITIKDDESIDKAVEYSLKYDLLSIPVINDGENLCGIVILNDIFDEVVPNKFKKKIRKAV